MPGSSPLLAAVGAALLAMAACYLWFGVIRRRRIEMESGIAALAALKWRECLGLILQALAREGYREEPSSRQPGDGGSEYLLRKGQQTCLLSYKHGTAYRLGEANIRDFANALQLQGAERGLLVTLGSSESAARDTAKRHGIELLDAAAVWSRVRDLLPPDIASRIRQHSAEVTRHGLQIGLIAGAALGTLMFLAIEWLRPPSLLEPTAAQAARAAPAAAPASVASAPPIPAEQDAASLQADAAAKALQTVAALTDTDRARNRAAAAASTAKIQQVASAAWSTQSTLLLTLRQSDGEDADLIAEACRILVQFEELRYTRLQLDPPPGSNLRVRWRQCQ